MNPRDSHRRLGWLLGVHFLVGAACASAALFRPGFGWGVFVDIGYLSLIASEALLLGTWIGFSQQRWFVRLLGGIGGGIWLAMLASAPFPDWTSTTVLEVCGMILPIPFVVASVATLFRWLFVRLQQADQWPTAPPGKDWQFTLRSLVGFMLVISLLLGLSRMLRELGSRQAPFFVGIICFVAVIATGLLVWSCLGLGRPLIRIPVAVIGMVASAMLVPYLSHHPELWRYLIWAGLMSAIAVIVGASLLVVRSCGYRLVAGSKLLSE